MILAFIVVLGVLFGFAWMNGRFGNTTVQKKDVLDEKVLYFEPEVVLEVGKMGEISLMGKYSGAPITGFSVELGYDSTLVKVEKIILGGNYDKLIESNIDENYGKIRIKAKSNYATGTIDRGLQKLATIQMTGLKKGVMVITNILRPEVTIFENGKNVEDDFTMRSFRVEVK